MHAAVLFDDGAGPALYVGGEFRAASGTRLDGIARWDGSAWVPVGGGLSGGVAADHAPMASTLAVYDDGTGPALFVAGSFEQAGAQAALNIAKWDGESWTPLGPGVGSQGGSAAVWSLQVFDDGTGPALYAGGGFELAGGLPIAGIARWDGHLWSDVGGGITGGVLSLAVFDAGDGDALYAGGWLYEAGGQSVNSIARWNGHAWSALGAGLTDHLFNSAGTAYGMSVFDDGTGSALYVGGKFDRAGGVPVDNLARWSGQTWSAVTTNFQGVVWATGVTEVATADLGNGTRLYVGGRFSTVNGKEAADIASFDGADWQPLSFGLNTAPDVLLQFTDAGGQARLFAGGTFTRSGAAVASHAATWDGQQWSGMGGSNEGQGLNDPVATMAVYDPGSGPQLVAGGSFSQAGPIPAACVAAWDGLSWSALGEGVRGPAGGEYVWSLTTHDDQAARWLYAGGAFLTADGKLTQSIARWNGSEWSALSGALFRAYEVSSMIWFDDGHGESLFAAGSLQLTEDGFVYGCMRWNGSTWSPVDAGAVDIYSVTSFVIFDDGKGPALYAAGPFSPKQGGAPISMAKWNGTKWSTIPGAPEWGVTALAIFDDGSGEQLYIGGGFPPAGSNPMSFVGRWNGQVWSEVGEGLNQYSDYGRGIVTLAVADAGDGPALYAGGVFTIAEGAGADFIQMWDGQDWAPLQGAVDGPVYSITGFDDGSGPALYIAGDFAGADGSASSKITRYAACPIDACTADCDTSGALDLFDFLCFVNAFNAGDPAADCDHSGALDLFDFLCFTNAFNTGC